MIFEISVTSVARKIMQTPRVLLLTTPNTYRASAFMAAAERLGVAVVTAINMPHVLAELWQQQLGIDFSDLDAATDAIVTFAATQPLDAIIALDDSGSLLAARASEALDLPHNSYEAALAGRDKHRMRQLLAAAGVPSPQFRLFSTADDPRAVAAQVSYPCVVKPTNLNGSRGVIRADNPGECMAAIARLTRLLNEIDPGSQTKPFLAEDFMPGFEVALEGLLDHGDLRVLALFDKPDPLDGPFFEETIYVTPSRLSAETQQAIADCAAAAAAALGLREGPLHAELRINEHGPWIVELTGRSIGGECSKTLQFGTDMSLEELILRQACGLPIESFERERAAGGVMMISIPGAGILRQVRGEEAARDVPLVTEVSITAKQHYPLMPLPEGDSYLGFIFAHGSTPGDVEAALRAAHSKLQFDIQPSIALVMK